MCGWYGVWRGGESGAGYAEVRREELADEPLVRMFVRYDEFEVRRIAMVARNGVSIELDEDEQKVLTGSAAREIVAKNRKLIRQEWPYLTCYTSRM